MPMANISFSLQLSGCGEGFTRSFEIVMIVPEIIQQPKFSAFILFLKSKHIASY